jgi:hypothetical protein
MQLSKKMESEVLEFHAGGLWSHEIARRTGVSYGGVQYILSRAGLQPNPKNYKVERKGSLIVCGTCHKPKLAKAFYARSGYKRCRKCLKQHRIDRLNSDPVWFFRERCVAIRKRARTKVGITPEFLMGLFTKQGGKCFYTDVDMVCLAGRGKNQAATSVDRIRSNKGYTKNNVVLCTLKANTVKSNLTLAELQSWLPDWFQRLVDAGLVSNT